MLHNYRLLSKRLNFVIVLCHTTKLTKYKLELSIIYLSINFYMTMKVAFVTNIFHTIEPAQLCYLLKLRVGRTQFPLFCSDLLSLTVGTPKTTTKASFFGHRSNHCLAMSLNHSVQPSCSLHNICKICSMVTRNFRQRQCHTTAALVFCQKKWVFGISEIFLFKAATANDCLNTSHE